MYLIKNKTSIHRILFASALFVSVLFFSVTFNAVAKAAPASCYDQSGSLTVSVPCGPSGGGSSASRTYLNSSGNSIPSPENDKCYVNTTSGSHVTYREYGGDCSELASQAATDEDRCRESGGEWNGARCEECPRGTTSNGTVCSGSASPARFSGDCSASLEAGNCGITAYILLFTNALSAIVGIVIVIMIVVGGIQYSAAQDNPQAVQAARTRIINALIGLVLYLFMFAFLQYIVPGGIL
jgi:hypothetical protein